MNADRIERLRIEYGASSLDPAGVAEDPFDQFDLWFGEAVDADVPEPNAMALATADESGRPGVRTVLLKDFDRLGFVFYTNLDSRKALDIAANPRVALCFTWVPLHRQVRIEGRATRVSDEEADDYFGSRPRAAQLGAHASHQSRVIPGRDWLERRFGEASARFASGPIPRPAWWSGFRVEPTAFEFWQGRNSRLHDRVRYVPGESGWQRERLAP